MAEVLHYPQLAARLRTLMGQAGLNGTGLSERIDASPGYMSRMLSGKKRPSTRLLKKLARVLNADYGELAALAGYSDVPVDDRPTILGWSDLTEADRALVLGLVARLTQGVTEDEEEQDEDHAHTPATTPQRRDRNRAELVTIYDALPPDDRVELLRVARAAHESVQRQSTPAREAPTPLRRREDQAPA